MLPRITIRELTTLRITEALAYHDHNRTKAARELCIGLKTLQRWIARERITPEVVGEARRRMQQNGSIPRDSTTVTPHPATTLQT